MSSTPVPANRAAGVSQQSLSPPGPASPVLPAGAEPAPASPALPDGAARPRRLDGFAVAALVTGMLALVPLAFGFAVAGLARTRRGRRAGRAAAVGGLVLAVAWTGAGAAVAAVLLGSAAGPAARISPLRGTVFSLRAGQCADTARNGVDGAHALPCGQPHQIEVYATFRLVGTTWPGTAALGQRASLGCLGRVGGYLSPGLLGTTLAGSYVYPDQGAWAAGERTVVCEVRGTSRPLTGSVRGLGLSTG
jgi:hypothetical protein